jgi:hypothetical protein
MKPNSYKEQKCCGTCRFVYVYWDYDDHEYYCHQDGSAVPRSYVGLTRDEVGIGSRRMMRSNEWNRWTKPRKVEFHGVCDEWKEKD